MHEKVQEKSGTVLQHVNEEQFTERWKIVQLRAAKVDKNFSKYSMILLMMENILAAGSAAPYNEEMMSTQLSVTCNIAV